MPHDISPALIGKAGEMLVAAELMRRGVEIAYPASDVGIDLLAYRLRPKTASAIRFIPIQVKAASLSNYRFLKRWFDCADRLVLVQVRYVARPNESAKLNPDFYVFSDLKQVEEAIGLHANSKSWTGERGIWSGSKPGKKALERMQPHRDQWSRIINQLDQ